MTDNHPKEFDAVLGSQNQPNNQPKEFDAVLGGQDRVSVPSSDKYFVLHLNPIAQGYINNFDGYSVPNSDRNFFNEVHGILALAELKGEMIGRSLLKFDIPLEYPYELRYARLSLFVQTRRTRMYAREAHSCVSSGHHCGKSNQWLLSTVASAWNEETITWNNQPDTIEPFQLMPASYHSNNGNYENIDITPLVRFCINQKINHGFLLKLEIEEGHRRVAFHAHKTEEIRFQPRLDLYYGIKHHQHPEYGLSLKLPRNWSIVNRDAIQ
jgi:hypothetical protein